MKTYRLIISITILALLVAACGQSATPEYHDTHLTEQPPTPAPQSGAGQSLNRIDVDGLGLTVDQATGKVVVDRVLSDGPGWLALHAEEGGAPGPVIGYTPVNEGENPNVTVTVNPADLTWKLYPMLYADEGTSGQFELGGADVPCLIDAQGRPIFLLERMYGDLSWVEVQDQKLGEGNTVVISRVFSPGPGILVVHAPDRPGRPGIGWAALQAGENRNVVVQVEIEGDSERLGAMLHADNSTLGKYDGFQTDPPASTLAGALLVVRFQASTK